MSETPTAARAPRVRKAAPKKAAPETTTAEDTNTKTYITLDPYPGPTVKNYTRYKVPEDGTGCAGTFYAPMDAIEVKVCVITPTK